MRFEIEIKNSNEFGALFKFRLFAYIFSVYQVFKSKNFVIPCLKAHRSSQTFEKSVAIQTQSSCLGINIRDVGISNY